MLATDHITLTIFLSEDLFVTKRAWHFCRSFSTDLITELFAFPSVPHLINMPVQSAEADASRQIIRFNKNRLFHSAISVAKRSWYASMQLAQQQHPAHGMGQSF